MKTTFFLLFSTFCAFQLVSQNLTEASFMADSAFIQGHYQFAANTYKRVIFFKRDEVDYDTYFKLSLCEAALGNLEAAKVHLDRAYFLTDEPSLKNEAVFEKIKILVFNKSWNEAQLELFNLNVTDTAEYNRKLFYQGLIYFGKEQFEDAYQSFLPLLRDSLKQNNLRGLLYSDDLRKPNPTTAKILSIFIPGSGQFYAKDYEAGINSIALTGALFVGGYYLAQIYAPVDALIAIAPWIIRYYTGGYTKAESIAQRQLQENQNQVLNKVIFLFE